MIKLHARLAGTSVLLVLATFLVACAVQPAPSPPPDTLAAAEVAAKPACYPKFPVQGDDDAFVEYLSETDCYRLGVCDPDSEETDGTGQCHKWGLGQDEPALPWSERLTNPQLGASIPPPEDLYEGFGEMTSDSCVENCQPVPVRLTNDTPLYEQPDTRSAVLANLPATECVGLKGYKLFSTPLRGVITATANGFVAGDVIYDLSYQGEGTYLAWWRGGYTSGEYDNPQVEWDPPPETGDPRAGLWREFVVADGASGWALDQDLEEYGSCEITQE